MGRRRTKNAAALNILRAEKDALNLSLAEKAERCALRLADGRRCGSPRWRGKELCYGHQRMENFRVLREKMGPMNDPNCVQRAISMVIGAIADGSVNNGQSGRLIHQVDLAMRRLNGRYAIAHAKTYHGDTKTQRKTEASREYTRIDTNENILG